MVSNWRPKGGLLGRSIPSANGNSFEAPVARAVSLVTLKAGMGHIFVQR